MKLAEWQNLSKNKVNKAINDCFNDHKIGGWQENHITTQVLKALSELGSEFSMSDKPQRTKWKSYKLSGKNETSYGDIGILVRVWFSEKYYRDGVAFYEAKKNYFPTLNTRNGYIFRPQQLNRLQKDTHASHVLLYDYDHINNTEQALVLPTNIVYSFYKHSRKYASGSKLNQYASSWIESLSSNLLGLNLDFSEQIVNEIKKLANDPNNSFFLLNATVAMREGIKLSLDSSWLKRSSFEDLSNSADDKNDPDPSQHSFGPKF